MRQFGSLHQHVSPRPYQCERGACCNLMRQIFPSYVWVFIRQLCFATMEDVTIHSFLFAVITLRDVGYLEVTLTYLSFFRIRQEMPVSIFNFISNCSIISNDGISTSNSPNFRGKQEETKQVGMYPHLTMLHISYA